MKVLALASLAVGLIFSACGSDATFRGSALKKLKIPGVQEPEEEDDSTTIVDPDSPVGDVVIDADGNPEGVDEGVPDTTTENTEDAIGRKSIKWEWPCNNNSVTPTDTILVGEGPHALTPGAIDVKIQGEICEPGEAPRDVIFVVDVSDSMRGLFNFGNDPLTQGSCGRLDAVKAVVATMGENDRVGFATFDGSLQRFSAGLLLPSEFLNQYGNTNVFCESGANTNFKRGLEKAEEILADARDDSSREVYFISDGESGSDASVGREVAARIRSEATLATMMLKGDDQILKNDLATQVGGVALHTKVQNAKDMANALATLARRDLASATLRWGAGNELDLDIENPLFALPFLSIDDSTDSFSVELEMVDSAGVVWSRQGSLSR